MEPRACREDRVNREDILMISKHSIIVSTLHASF